ncbi:MAG TPA: DUF305 domain-containing protein [Pusillimonas sp.]|nr:DUF305 domain-containing protein [Pusillimonas sp.]
MICTLSTALAGVSAQAQTTPQALTTGNVQQGETQLVQEDQTFLENATQGSYAEIEGSRLAQEKGSSKEVKDFAAMMIKDHSKMIEEVSALATEKDYEVPNEPSVMQTAEITALKALSGDAFDAMYINRIGVASHEATVQMFEEAARQAKDPDVKALAAKTLPKLREHLEMARKINQKQESE